MRTASGAGHLHRHGVFQNESPVFAVIESILTGASVANHALLHTMVGPRLGITVPCKTPAKGIALHYFDDKSKCINTLQPLLTGGKRH
jgi:hypothetical protein